MSLCELLNLSAVRPLHFLPWKRAGRHLKTTLKTEDEMTKPQIIKHWIVVFETANAWLKFDRIRKEAGYTTRTAAFKALLRYVIQTGKFPRI